MRIASITRRGRTTVWTVEAAEVNTVGGVISLGVTPMRREEGRSLG